MMASACTVHALLNQLSKINRDALFLSNSRLPGPKHLFDGIHKTVGIFKHQAVEGVALGVLELPALESLQVEADGSNRGFQLVGNSVDKAVVLFVLSDFADQKAGVQDQAGSNGSEEDDSQQDFDTFLPVEDDPAKDDEDRNAGQHNAKREKENNFAAAAYAHEQILARRHEAANR